MWYYNGEIIKTPKVMTIRDKRYSKEIFQDSSALSSLGIKPYRSVVPDSRYYLAGSYSVDTSGDEVIGTYAGTAKDLANLRTNMLSRCKKEVNSLLAEIDWYWIRASKSGGASVPSAIATYSAALYSEYGTKKTEIGNLDTIAKIIEYSGRAYTETRKLEVLNEDGSFKEYHASTTYTRAREIDMCTHFTVHPDKTDAGQVSLTAD
tara:strand:- start:13 stop:630 length:618 start_codon:yes stop_codon:yes gene_type:complete